MIAVLREKRGVTGGCFRLPFAEEGLYLSVSDSLRNLAIYLFRSALGDHRGSQQEMNSKPHCFRVMRSCRVSGAGYRSKI